jgi:prephenate dehydrogenase
VHDTISKNIRETAIMGTGGVGSMGSSFMEFSSDDAGPRFGITEIERKPNNGASGNAKKQNGAKFEQIDLYDDMAFEDQKSKNKPAQTRKDMTQTTAATRDPYDF